MSDSSSSAPCYHGGAFFSAIGERFDTLDRAGDIIAADVLDAWFPPAPGVLSELRDRSAWLARTSPPTQCSGMLSVIAEARAVPETCLLPGAGSSDLIFRAFTRWMNAGSRVVILDPMYGEYAHVLDHVVGCGAIRFRLRPEDDFDIGFDRLENIVRDADWLVLVNPNSPTGRHADRDRLEAFLRKLPATVRVWIDETYVEYAGDNASLETFAAGSENVVVCKSLSKVFALSGLRAAYLCGNRKLMTELRRFTPPWVVGLPAQVAVVRAFGDLPYYREMWRRTAAMRETLARHLESSGWRTVPGMGNMILGFLPETGPTAATLIARCRERGLFLRDASGMGTGLGDRAVRVAVRSPGENGRMAGIIAATQ